MEALELEPLGDAGLLIRAPQRIDPDLNDLVQRLAAHLRASLPAGVVDVVPSYASLALLCDPVWLASCAGGLEGLTASLRPRLEAAAARGARATRTVTLPVCYGGALGPDLREVAARVGLSEEEVVRRHAAAEYRVALLGFAPGFPYLLGLDERLAVPRRETPRVRVPAGSVAIGGSQTGVYPRESPGGWQLIGRTRAVLFDETADPPTLLSPGDRVRFRPIDAARLDDGSIEVEVHVEGEGEVRCPSRS